MSRFILVAPQEATDPVVQRVYREIEVELGFGIVPNVFRAMAMSPPFLEASWNGFRATVLSGLLPRLVKEMVGVVVSTVHNSNYARLVHLHSLGVQGVAPETLEALTEGRVDAAGLAPSVVAALGFARAMAAAPGNLADDDFAALRAAGLSDGEIYELIATVQLFTAVNLFTDSVDVELDQI